MNYRNEARLRLEAANRELASGDDARLKYAALDLRMAMEALTYDRALAYKDEFPPTEYETWQPRRVMAVLLEIDPWAGSDSALAIGEEPALGVPTSHMESMGTDVVLSLSTIKQHYDALGNYLHLPSLKQSRSAGGLDVSRLRARCGEIAGAVERVLSSPVFNITLGEFARFECMRCQKPIRRRLPRDRDDTEAECFDCRATYTVVKAPNGQAAIHPKRQEVPCSGAECAGRGHFWDADLKVGAFWRCSLCGGRNLISLAQSYERGA